MVDESYPSLWSNISCKVKAFSSLHSANWLWRSAVKVIFLLLGNFDWYSTKAGELKINKEILFQDILISLIQNRIQRFAISSAFLIRLLTQQNPIKSTPWIPLRAASDCSIFKFYFYNNFKLWHIFLCICILFCSLILKIECIT